MAITLDGTDGVTTTGLTSNGIDDNATSTAITIDSSGHAIIPAGVTLGTSVGVYSAANTLDDYEEGTWTPNNSGNVTINAINNATYVKIGNVVTINAWINVNLTSSSFIIGGLPYSISGRTSAVVTNVDAAQTLINQALGTTIYGYGASTSGTNDGVFISLTYRIA